MKNSFYVKILLLFLFISCQPDAEVSRKKKMCLDLRSIDTVVYSEERKERKIRYQKLAPKLCALNTRQLEGLETSKWKLKQDSLILTMCALDTSSQFANSLQFYHIKNVIEENGVWFDKLLFMNNDECVLGYYIRQEGEVVFILDKDLPEYKHPRFMHLHGENVFLFHFDRLENIKGRQEGYIGRTTSSWNFAINELGTLLDVEMCQLVCNYKDDNLIKYSLPIGEYIWSPTHGILAFRHDIGEEYMYYYICSEA